MTLPLSFTVAFAIGVPSVRTTTPFSGCGAGHPKQSINGFGDHVEAEQRDVFTAVAVGAVPSVYPYAAFTCIELPSARASVASMRKTTRW